MTRAYAPRDLGDAGRRLWRDVAAAYELTVGERLLLNEACRCADLCDALHVKAGKAGASRLVMTELRYQRAALAKLVEQLKI